MMAAMLELLLFVIILVVLQVMDATLWQVILAFGAWAIVSMPGAWLIFRGAPPLVPTSHKTVAAMMRLADIKPGEKVYDVGCGDGRLVFAAAALGARAVGYELSVLAYLLAKFRSLFHRGSSIRYGDFWKKDVSDADVIVCYLLIGAMANFKESIWKKLKPGTRVVSHGFKLPDVEIKAKENGAYLYVR